MIPRGICGRSTFRRETHSTFIPFARKRKKAEVGVTTIRKSESTDRVFEGARTEVHHDYRVYAREGELLQG